MIEDFNFQPLTIFTKSSIIFLGRVQSTPLRQPCIPQPGFTWSKLTIETLEQGVKYVQS